MHTNYYNCQIIYIIENELFIDPLCKDGNARFTTVLIKFNLIKIVEGNVVFMTGKVFISVSVCIVS